MTATDSERPLRARHLGTAAWNRLDAAITRVDGSSTGVAIGARFAAVVVLIGLATLVLLALDAQIAAAAITLLALVALAACFGRAYGVWAALCSYLALNWWFTDPVHGFGLEKVEDLVPLVTFAVAAIACSVPSAHLDVRPVGAVVVVGVTVAILVSFDADLVIAALILLGVVVLTAVMGFPSAATAVGASYVGLNYWFIPPVGSLEITNAQDLAPLIAFGVAAAASAVTVARINWLRQHAAATEQQAFEARVAQATSDSRAAFLAAMTHNLRTPLATIKTSVSALLASPDSPVDRRVQLLTTARGETDRLERLVTKVLELARIHAGAVEPVPEPVDLGELAGAAVRRLDRLASDGSVRVKVYCGDIVVATVDPDMIDLVVIVMLENALRYAPTSSQIDVVVESTPNGDATVRVIDHGPGVPLAQHEAVFEEFVRLDRDSAGSGLGLTIARTMVEAHGGRMWIEDTPGGGATAVISIPREEQKQ
jgi:two-component system sensor histidine kinase KdpD